MCITILTIEIIVIGFGLFLYGKYLKVKQREKLMIEYYKHMKENKKGIKRRCYYCETIFEEYEDCYKEGLCDDIYMCKYCNVDKRTKSLFERLKRRR